MKILLEKQQMTRPRRNHIPASRRPLLRPDLPCSGSQMVNLFDFDACKAFESSPNVPRMPPTDFRDTRGIEPLSATKYFEKCLGAWRIIRQPKPTIPRLTLKLQPKEELAMESSQQAQQRI